MTLVNSWNGSLYGPIGPVRRKTNPIRFSHTTCRRLRASTRFETWSYPEHTIDSHGPVWRMNDLENNGMSSVPRSQIAPVRGNASTLSGTTPNIAAGRPLNTAV